GGGPPPRPGRWPRPRRPRADPPRRPTVRRPCRRRRRSPRPIGAATLPSVALPLDGIVVADLTQNVAGPFCTQTLGDMGADVVKVERPGRGDDARAWGPPFWGHESAVFLALNRNKKSLALDLKREGGVEILKRLVGRVDVFVQSLRAGVIEELGLDFAGATRLNRRLVYCSITAFGTEGPLASLPGYDPLMQAYAGLMCITGHPGQEPARVGTSIDGMATG